MHRSALFLFALLLGPGLCSAAESPKTFTGVISDEMCTNDHKMMSITPDSKCVLECVKSGSKFALVSGSKVYKLSDQTAPAKFPGQKVTITGTLSGETITVQSIAAAK